jgi:3-hydroxyanthranilate 3,4-dioxygenase
VQRARLSNSARSVRFGSPALQRTTPARYTAQMATLKDPELAPPPAGLSFPLVHLQRWIKAHAHELKPPVSNKQLFKASSDAIVFVSGGPNTRNDYHVNPTEELFYQLKGNIAVRVRPLDGSPPHDVIIREGELFLLPRWVPHRPQRPADTIGLIIEFPRGFDAQGKPHMDGLRWYCPNCDHLVHEARWVLTKIDVDLKIIMEDFWSGPADRRTCRSCGHIIERAGAIALDKGKVRAARQSKPRNATKKSNKPGSMSSAKKPSKAMPSRKVAKMTASTPAKKIAKR